MVHGAIRTKTEIKGGAPSWVAKAWRGGNREGTEGPFLCAKKPQKVVKKSREKKAE